MTTREANERLASDFKQLIRDAEDLLKATAGDASEKMKEVRGRLATGLQSARTSCERLQDRTWEVARASDVVVRDHPYESIGVAFFAGLLIGVLLARD